MRKDCEDIGSLQDKLDAEHSEKDLLNVLNKSFFQMAGDVVSQATIMVNGTTLVPNMSSVTANRSL
jgi:hypothetical protein